MDIKWHLSKKVVRNTSLPSTILRGIWNGNTHSQKNHVPLILLFWRLPSLHYCDFRYVVLAVALSLLPSPALPVGGVPGQAYSIKAFDVAVVFASLVQSGCLVFVGGLAVCFMRLLCITFLSFTVCCMFLRFASCSCDLPCGVSYAACFLCAEIC